MKVIPFQPRHLVELCPDGRDPGAALVRPEDVDPSRLVGLTFREQTTLACCGLTRLDDGSAQVWLFADETFRLRPITMVRTLRQWLAWIENIGIAAPLWARAATDWPGANRLLSHLGFTHRQSSHDGLFEEYVKNVGT
ncbi:MAG: hypothetical protein ACFB6R_14505 [Alphaproteobacteria bacterium]